MGQKKTKSTIILTIIGFLSVLIIVFPLLVVFLGSFKDAPEAQAFNLVFF